MAGRIVPALKKRAFKSWPTNRTGLDALHSQLVPSVVAPYFDGRSRFVQLLR